MEKIGFCIILCAIFAVSNGIDDSNYDISRNKLGGYGIREILDYLIGGAGYGQHYPGYYPGNQGPGYYPGNQGSGLYPSGPGYPGQYPGSQYPGYQHPPGPPGAHPGCPLCDSSVYSYCSHKEAHDACCCDNPAYLPYNCRKSDCKFLYANSCQEFQLISSCCCVDLHKNAVAPVVAPVA